MEGISTLSILFTVSFGYFVSDDVFLTRDAARAYCQQKGFDLASIHTTAQFEETSALCRTKDPAPGWGCWIGLRRQVAYGAWSWTDGTAFDYGGTDHVIPWHPAEPKEPATSFCVHIADHESYKWNDLPCNGPYKNYAMCNEETEEGKEGEEGEDVHYIASDIAVVIISALVVIIIALLCYIYAQRRKKAVCEEKSKDSDLTIETEGTQTNTSNVEGESEALVTLQ